MGQYRTEFCSRFIGILDRHRNYPDLLMDVEIDATVYSHHAKKRPIIFYAVNYTALLH